MEPEGGDLIVVGLGNPGPEYASTRHNMGFRCVEELARRLGVETGRKRWRSLVGSGPLPGAPAGSSARLWIVRPQTFMNESGRAVREAVRDLSVGPDRIWVVYDELDLPLCRLRIRRGGSAAGHNGVASVMASLGSADFVRFRVGIGRPGEGQDPVRYVLSPFSKAESERLGAVVDGAATALETALSSGLARAMELYNRTGSLGCEELP